MIVKARVWHLHSVMKARRVCVHMIKSPVWEWGVGTLHFLLRSNEAAQKKRPRLLSLKDICDHRPSHHDFKIIMAAHCEKKLFISISWLWFVARFVLCVLQRKSLISSSCLCMSLSAVSQRAHTHTVYDLMKQANTTCGSWNQFGGDIWIKTFF